VHGDSQFTGAGHGPHYGRWRYCLQLPKFHFVPWHEWLAALGQERLRGQHEFLDWPKIARPRRPHRHGWRHPAVLQSHRFDGGASLKNPGAGAPAGPPGCMRLPVSVARDGVENDRAAGKCGHGLRDRPEAACEVDAALGVDNRLARIEVELCARQPSCLTSCSHSRPVGGSRRRTGADRSMKRNFVGTRRM
jgi:hypothetical protein